jgi:hypothetical protein
MILILLAVTAAGLGTVTGASARGGGGHGGGFHGGSGFHGGGFHRGGFGGYGFGGYYGGYYGGYPYAYPYAYGGYENEGSCYLVRRRIATRHGMRIRRVEVCD